MVLVHIFQVYAFLVHEYADYDHTVDFSQLDGQCWLWCGFFLSSVQNDVSGKHLPDVDCNNNCFFLLHSSLPWNQKTMWGYIAEILYVMLNCQTYMLATGILLIFFIESCYHHHAFYKMFSQMISTFNLSPHRNYNDDKQHLYDLVRFHVTIRE